MTEAAMDDVTVGLGVPDDQNEPATALYCAAFREKLQPFLGPPERAARFLSAGLRQDRIFAALLGGEVIGIAGFKLDRDGLFGLTLGHALREYGVSTPFRLAGLAMLERPEEPDCLLMDGIAVDARARGRGIGTRLLGAIEDHARSLGKTQIRLDVIDTNPGARRLYERFGFEAGKTEDVGLMRLVFPFRRSTEMRKRLERDQSNGKPT